MPMKLLQQEPPVAHALPGAATSAMAYLLLLPCCQKRSVCALRLDERDLQNILCRFERPRFRNVGVPLGMHRIASRSFLSLVPGEFLQLCLYCWHRYSYT